MKRRLFFKTMGATAAVAALPLTVKADSSLTDSEIVTEIGSNHGHDLQLSIKDALILLKETRGGNTVDVDIQGASGHPHHIVVDESVMVALLAQEAVTVQSSTDAGHAHAVDIELIINA